MEEKKMTKEKILKMVAREQHMPYAVVKANVDGVLQKVIEYVFLGYTVYFCRFGTFCRQDHKGHPVQFGKKGKEIRPYAVFKFAASSQLNKALRVYADNPDKNVGLLKMGLSEWRKNADSEECDECAE